MGIDINFMFQSKQNGVWKDIACEYNGYAGRYPELFEWLGIGGYESATSLLPSSEPRGFPADFAIVDEAFHPVQDVNVLPKSYSADRLEAMRILMGGSGFSWFHADEILNAASLVETETIGVSIENFRRWDGVSIPDEYEVLPNNWKENPRFSGGNFSWPEEISAATKYIVLEVEYDIDTPAPWFIELLQRLKNQYGEVRIVFGFS